MTDAEEVVILVDANDRPTGLAPKLKAHVEGLRHRAISALVFNKDGDMLLQRRNRQKYHSGGLWTNACCSHPRPDETPRDAAMRRLDEEMGVRIPLEFLFVVAYRAPVGGLIEDEVVHVFGGFHDGDPSPDANEIDAWEWRSIASVAADLAARPERYTVWFATYMRDHRAAMEIFAARRSA